MKVLLLSQIAVVDYKYTFSLANALLECGNEVELVIDDKKDNEYCKCVCWNKFQTSRKDIGKVSKVINYISSYRFIVKKAISESFDVVHVQWFQFSAADYLYLKKLKKNGIKVVVSVHDILPYNEKWYDMMFHRKIYGICDNIIVQAETNVKRFEELFPEDKERLTYIPHGNFIDFATICDQSQSRQKLGVPEDRFIVMFFGQIKKSKGVDVLIKAFGELRQRRDDIFLIIAGSLWKDSFSHYQELLDQYGLEKTDYRADIKYISDEEVGTYFSACDVAALPYTDVYQSGIVHLSYAHEKPVIASSLPAFTEIVEEGKTGFLCEPGNPQSLMEAIEKAKERKQDLREMGILGKERIKARYSWKDIGERITELYKR